MFYIVLGDNIDDKVASTSLHITELSSDVSCRVTQIFNFLNERNIDFTDKYVFLWSAPKDVLVHSYKYNTLDFILISTPKSRADRNKVWLDDDHDVWLSEITRHHLMAFGTSFNN